MPPARPVLPAWAAQASAAAIAPSAAAASVSRPIHAPMRHPAMALRGRTAMRAVPTDASGVEAEMMKILSDTNETAARLYAEADLLHLPILENGELSVRFWLAELETTMPPPATTFDQSELVGKWQLVYTNDLPLAVRDEVARHADGLVQDMSVVLSISDKMAMSKTTVISRLGEESTTFNDESYMVQQQYSPSFTVVGSDGESMAAHITYSSKDLLVMRKEDDVDRWLSQVFQSNGLPPSMPNVEVWKRINGHAVETPSAASPVLLWRFGLLALALGLTTGDTNVVSTSSSPTIEPPQNYSLYTRFLFAITLVSAVCSYIWSLCQKPTQPRVESTELASYGESNSAYLPSMDEEQQCQTPSPTDDSSSWFSLARIRAMFLSALAALSLNLYEPSAHAAGSGGRIGGSARAARTRSPSPRASPQLRSNTTVIERNNTTVIAPPPVGFSPGLGMGGPVIVAPAPTLGDIVVGAAVDGAVRGVVSGATGGPHHGPSSTDRMLENQQRQDERQIDKQATEIEALKKELDQLKAEKK
eukprot:TRINITY_DN350_c0_g1_i6.p1 TRINITY_DN350_c0_g1~~TRINITY_DN350_c0_g1_i6.p1  ORF type:complete len:533 (-),score=67.04 TRINITY_DN350_c0_g1_i6:224-1822(-)